MARTYLSACLCFKNAAPYLAEWLGFYTVLGVERFYLYDNESTDDFEGALEPFRAAIRLTRYAGRRVQHAVYQHCLANHGPSTRWMMFCDDDEFLFPVREVTLPEALSPYERYAGVGVAWAMYGSSGHVKRPEGFVIENYTRRRASPDPNIKCVVNPERIIAPLVIAHQFRCRGALMVDEKFHPLRGPIAPFPTIDTLRINHYATKSREEMRERRSRIQANTGEVSPLSLDEWRRLDDTYNEVEDAIALRYVAKIRGLSEGKSDQPHADLRLGLGPRRQMV
jgi:hypothetical protein